MNEKSFSQSDKILQEQIDKTLRSFFKEKIKQNFLIRMKYKVLDLLGNKADTYFTSRLAPEDFAMNEFLIEYEICKLIVGVHRSNLIFLTDSEKVEKENSLSYCEQLAKDVIENIKLRDYAGAFFRKGSLLQGESFIYYPLPYHLFAISIRLNKILSKHSEESEFRPLIVQISNKGLAALSLLEDNLLDSAYPLCRSAMELFIKMLLLTKEPQIMSDYYKFEEFEVQQSFLSQTYPQEFNELFDKRKNQKEYNKVEYLHFGWIDGIADYHKVVCKKPYTINGIITYLRGIDEEDNTSIYENFERLYKMCHGYTHGNIFTPRYPLMQYLEISTMLCYVLVNTYKVVCDYYNEPYAIDNVDIMALMEVDWNQVCSQYNLCNAENLEAYYKRQQ